jgi:hypothetical protein
MEQMFGVHVDRQNVSGIPVSSFTQADINKATAALTKQYPDKKIIPVVLVPMTKHSTEEETRAYFEAKHAFLSRSLPSQFVDRRRLEDRAALQWSISNIGLALFAKMGGVPWRMKPSTERCLIVGIGQAHRVVSGRIERYFAYSVLADSSGIYESIRLLGNSTDPDEYLSSLTSNLRDVLLSHKEKYSSFVLHLTFSMKKREIDAIKNLLNDLKGDAVTNREFVVLKFNDKNDYLGFSADHNSRVPYEGSVLPLSRREFLLWFSGLRTEDSKIPAKPERPVHIKVLYPEEPLTEADLRRVLQDSVNIAGANWRGFNAKSMPISVYYAKLVADYFAHFGEYGLPDVSLESMSPWFL